MQYTRVLPVPVGMQTQMQAVSASVSTSWGSEWSDCCNPSCGSCCEHFCCAPCKFGEIVGSLPRGSAVCAGSCCGGGLLYGSLGAVVYAGALAASAFFGLGLALTGVTGLATGCYHGHIRRAFRKVHGLQPRACDDYPVAIFCDLCALCQETRELSRRRNPLIFAQPLPNVTVLQAPGIAMMPMGGQFVAPGVPAPAPVQYPPISQVTVGYPGGAFGAPPSAPAAPAPAAGGVPPQQQEPLADFLDRLGLSAYLPDLREMGVDTVAGLASLTEAQLERTAMKPAERERLLASRPGGAAAGGSGTAAGVGGGPQPPPPVYR